MMVRSARPTDAPAMAALHLDRLSFGLLSQLGYGFVTDFYEALLQSPLGCGFVAERNGRVVGFTTGVTDWRRFARTFLRSHLWTAARGAFFVLRTGRLRRFLETMRYAQASNLPEAELVSIAVATEVEGMEVAQALAQALFEEFKTRGLRAVRVTVGGANIRSQRFFEKLGLQRLPLDMHKGESAILFVLSLESPAESAEPQDAGRTPPGTGALRAT